MNDSTVMDNDDLGRVLRAAGATVEAAEAHGMFCGRACLEGAGAIRLWGEDLLDGTEAGNVLVAECRSALDALAADSLLKLEAGEMTFALLLPDDNDSIHIRTAALADWCHGFMHGLVVAGGGDQGPANDVLQDEIAGEILEDFSEITKAGAASDEGEESERAFVELVEYVRVSVQLIYDETAALRDRVAAASRSH